ncbi:MAG: SEC-C domain-containing protein [Actinomycetota bacterium]|nr:SEC-C domain-containing protein [Actinomycetota bacterium]
MGITRLSPVPLVEEAALKMLADQGPLREEELEKGLAAAGLDLGIAAEDHLAGALAPPRVVELHDERLVDVVAMADGVVLSHVLRAIEVAEGRIALHPDLSVLEDLSTAGVALECAAGPLVHEHTEGEGACLLVGPTGWLGPTASAGEVVSIEVGSGRTTASVAPGPLPARPEPVAALRTAFEALNGDAGDEPQPVELFTLWLEALVADPEAFRRPQAPLGQLLTAAGLETRDELVANAGFDWREWAALLTVDLVARRWGLDHLGRLMWLIVTLAYRSLSTADLFENDAEADKRHWARLADVLSHATVAEAFMGQTLESQPDREGSVTAFAERLCAAASGRAQAGPLWLRAVCAERNGETLEAERFLARALSADGSYVLALSDAAWYAADRGDARRAASLLRQAGAASDDEILAVYDYYARVAHVRVGRNQPCPCRSGRKYKHCHLGQAFLPLAERGAFLYEKARAYMFRGRHSRAVFDIAVALVGGADDLAALRDAVEGPTVADLALFEGHVWDDFVRDRGMLLPADELVLAQQWQIVERSVYKLQAFERSGRMTMRDVRSGDVVEVVGYQGSHQLEAGASICARVFFDGDGHQILGGIEPVGSHEVDRLIQLLATRPGAVELARWFATAHAAAAAAAAATAAAAAAVEHGPMVSSMPNSVPEDGPAAPSKGQLSWSFHEHSLVDAAAHRG